MHYLFGLILMAALPFACGERPPIAVEPPVNVDAELAQRAP
jgi:hypothetical protein